MIYSLLFSIHEKLKHETQKQNNRKHHLRNDIAQPSQKRCPVSPVFIWRHQKKSIQETNLTLMIAD